MSSKPSKTILDPHIKMVFKMLFYLGITSASSLADHGLDSLDAI